MRAFRTYGRRYAGAEMAGWADVFGKFGVNPAELGDFVHGSGIDFFLSIEASAHGPLVQEMKKRSGFDQADRFCVGKKVKRDFQGHAAVEKFVLGRPSVAHGAIVNFLGPGISLDELRRDEIGVASVGEGKKRAGAWNHAVALVL